MAVGIEQGLAADVQDLPRRPAADARRGAHQLEAGRARFAGEAPADDLQLAAQVHLAVEGAPKLLDAFAGLDDRALARRSGAIEQFDRRLAPLEPRRRRADHHHHGLRLLQQRVVKLARDALAFAHARGHAIELPAPGLANTPLDQREHQGHGHEKAQEEDGARLPEGRRNLERGADRRRRPDGILVARWQLEAALESQLAGPALRNAPVGAAVQPALAVLAVERVARGGPEPAVARQRDPQDGAPVRAVRQQRAGRHRGHQPCESQRDTARPSPPKARAKARSCDH